MEGKSNSTIAHLDDTVFLPTSFKLTEEEDRLNFDLLLKSGMILFTHDEIYGQLKELIKVEQPQKKLEPKDYELLISERLAGTDVASYGVWFFYPWNRRLIHLLDEEEFIAVRTSRNQHKITKAEQDILKNKTIGIAGLSVGHSIAITIAMERACGRLRLADFDVAELSNLNRIHTGIHNLGLEKTILLAREIAEIDPYIKIALFSKGLSSANMDSFFLDDGKLDLFVEVCDSIDIKLLSRLTARKYQIPVVMDTNDRGMLDVERFDKDRDLPLLHGLIGEIDPDTFRDLPFEKKLPVILGMVGIETISARLKASMIEIGQSITTWPQLASSVMLGGALTTDVCRRILLGQFNDSGRYYVDFEELIKDADFSKTSLTENYDPPPELDRGEMFGMIDKLHLTSIPEKITEEEIKLILEAAILAPSGGNSQPWKFVYTLNRLFIFVDAHFSHSLIDFNNFGSYLSLGAVIENIAIKSAALSLEIGTVYFPLHGDKRMAGLISFTRVKDKPNLASLERGIYLRQTSRTIVKSPPLSPDHFTYLKQSISQYHGAHLDFVDDREQIMALGEILAHAEKLRVLHPRGHFDTFVNELRWTQEENELKRDGLDIRTLGISESEALMLKIAADANAISVLRNIGGGNAFEKMVIESVKNSSALGIIYMPELSELDCVLAGRAVERLWIEANLLNLSFQPITQLTFLLARLKLNSTDVDPEFSSSLQKLKASFDHVLPRTNDGQAIFIFKIGHQGKYEVRSLRKPLGFFLKE
ncbi:Rv1355c family protein [Pedobacter sp. Leaf216]|uniref:Rv1355c family protein n=1 Tax=Pedobacter sp. Leaf216 TaxID=1735684 RepID=UPI0009E6A958|nr:Rv1355c family protein [Pedobacter sp. Leaf216]